MMAVRANVFERLGDGNNIGQTKLLWTYNLRTIFANEFASKILRIVIDYW
jgi:hypothetical protein